MHRKLLAKGAEGIAVYHIVHYATWVLVFGCCYVADIDVEPLLNAVSAATGYNIGEGLAPHTTRLASAWFATLILVKVLVPFKIWATIRLLDVGLLSRAKVLIQRRSGHDNLNPDHPD